MAKRLRAGDVIPEFRFDTPYHPQQSFYELLEGDKPVFLVFLRNFGHPLTRNYIMEYIKSAGSLRSARLVCVVQTKPQTISRAIPEGAMPYELMCDAEGVLYRFFAVPSEKSRMKCFSLKAMKIINEAKKQGIQDISIQLSIPADTGQILASDLCVVVGNLLENAITACAHVPPGQARIQMRSRQRFDILALTLDNSYAAVEPAEGGLFRSTKPGGGTGLTSIRSIAEKYQGGAEFTVKDGLFCSSLYMRLR